MVYYIINSLIIIVIIWYLARSARSSPVYPHFFWALSIRIAAGILLGVLYFQYYKGGDTIVFHMAAIQLSQIASNSFSDYLWLLGSQDVLPLIENPAHVLVETRSLFFAKTLSLFYLLTGSNYWISSIYLSILSFIGSWGLINTISRYYKKLTFPAVMAFLYFIPAVFWTSGVIKESLAWFLLAYLMKLFLEFYHEKPVSIKKLALILLMFIPLWMIKYHYAAVLLICMNGILVYDSILSRLRNMKLSFVLLGITYLFIGFLITQMHPNFRLNRIIEVIYDNQQEFITVSRPGNTISFIDYPDPVIRFMINIPVSLFSGLFMPLPWQGDNFLPKIVGLINISILALFILKIVKLIQSPRASFNIVFISLALYCIILAIFIAYSTPNFGTLERYKAGFMPFFVMWIIYENYFMNLFRKGFDA